jgi:uncharacterized protein (TIGR04255 family)
MAGFHFSQLPKLPNPPIVEAVLDIDCDLPPGLEIANLEEVARAQFIDRYPKLQTQFLHQHRLEAQGQASIATALPVAIQAYQFSTEDGTQLVQVRAQGFSFNRLAPYASLDDYLPEIERAWRVFLHLVTPVQVRAIRLRYINRILLPLMGGRVDLDEFLTIGPRFIKEGLQQVGFLLQEVAKEEGTGHDLNLVLASQAPEPEHLPIILDITAGSAVSIEPTDWGQINACIRSLRALKNRVFSNSLTEKCIQLFQS